MPYDLKVNFNQEASSALASDLNYVNPTAFQLVIDNLKYPNAQFNVQQVALPELSVTNPDIATRQRNILATPAKVNYGSLELTFLIDEKLINYMEIHDWIYGLATEQESKSLKTQRDLQLLILDSNNNVAREIQFVNAQPVSLGSIPFDITSADIAYLTATVSFEYDYFKFKRDVI